MFRPGQVGANGRGSRSPFNALGRKRFPSFSASVGGDLETRANFDNRGRSPSHGILRWIVQKRCRMSASGPLAGGTRPFPRQVEADRQGRPRLISKPLRAPWTTSSACYGKPLARRSQVSHGLNRTAPWSVLCLPTLEGENVLLAPALWNVMLRHSCPHCGHTTERKGSFFNRATHYTCDHEQARWLIRWEVVKVV